MDNEYVGYVERETYRGATDVVIYKKLVGDPRVEIATDLVAKWGAVAAAPDGEDTAGRQKVRLQTTDELVERACDVAAALFAAFEQRAWLVPLPAPKMEEKAVKA